MPWHGLVEKTRKCVPSEDFGTKLEQQDVAAINSPRDGTKNFSFSLSSPGFMDF
jgi:hypothetical protein